MVNSAEVRYAAFCSREDRTLQFRPLLEYRPHIAVLDSRRPGRFLFPPADFMCEGIGCYGHLDGFYREGIGVTALT